MGATAQFTHWQIILLQCFQLSVFSKIRHLLIVQFRKLTKFGFKFGFRLRLKLPSKKLKWLRARLDWAYCASAFRVWCFLFLFLFYFLFSTHMNSKCTVHAHGFTMRKTKCTIQSTYNHFIQKKKNLKMVSTALFTHLKIILLQYFQFSVFCKISCIRTDPVYFENLNIDYIFLYS